MRRVFVISFLIGSLGGCSDDSGQAPGSDGSTWRDLAKTTDGVKNTDGPRIVDGLAMVDGAPRLESSVSDDLKRPDGALQQDGTSKLDTKKTDGVAAKCSPNPCQHGGTCSPTSAGFTCGCTAGWKGTLCETASYCDVLYRVTGTFHTTEAPLIGQFSKTVGTNATQPSFNPASTTPFTPSAFPKGFLRLRFPNAAGAPAAGPVKIIEYFMPMEFSVNTVGTVVNTDVDHSAGLLQLSGSPQAIGNPPALGRTCAAVASGTLTGTTLTWETCGANPDNSIDWTFAKAVSGDPGCLHRMSVWGNVNCSAGLCNLVPGTGNQRQTWDQKLKSFVFSGTNLATATFTMEEVQTPNVTSVKTFIGLKATSVVKVECDTTGNPLVCDEQ